MQSKPDISSKVPEGVARHQPTCRALRRAQAEAIQRIVHVLKLQVPTQHRAPGRLGWGVRAHERGWGPRRWRAGADTVRHPRRMPWPRRSTTGCSAPGPCRVIKSVHDHLHTRRAGGPSSRLVRPRAVRHRYPWIRLCTRLRPRADVVQPRPPWHASAWQHRVVALAIRTSRSTLL